LVIQSPHECNRPRRWIAATTRLYEQRMGGLVRAGDVFAGHRVVEYPLGDW